MSHWRMIALAGLGWMGMVAGQANGALLSAEPDHYSDKVAIPDNIGVKLRTSSYRPGHAEFNRSHRRVYARQPYGSVYCIPSTGDLVLAGKYYDYFNGTNYGVRAWFVDTDNQFTPTSYVGFDICWASLDSWSERVRVVAYGDDIDGNEVEIYRQTFDSKNAGDFSSLRLFLPGIKWLKAICWDDPAQFRQQAFTLDNFEFADQSGNAFAVPAAGTLEAPAGLLLGANDSLSGAGTVAGSVTNGGSVSPGLSPGTLRIDGDYSQGPGATYNCEIYGPDPAQVDRIVVTGHAELDGVLRILLMGYTPSLGESFTVMEYASVEGTFELVAPEGVEFQADYGPTALSLTVVPEPTSAALLGLAGLGLLRRRRNRS